MAEETEKLIDFVRSFPYLYDTRHADYKNIIKKAETWKEIAGILNISSEIVKQKWKNLRDSYIKYLKGSSTGSAKKYQNWPWADHLEYLKDTIAPRLTALTIQQSSETSRDNEAHEEDEADSVSGISPSYQPPPAKTPKRKKVSQDVAEVLKYLENKKKNEAHLDHVDHLFLSYSHTFKKLSPRTQAILKMELAQLFGQAELRELDAHSSAPSP